jgi:glycosyltransferase involved in cell wall biosynthesis
MIKTIGMISMSYYPEPCGGAERQCNRLTTEFLSRGYCVKILTTRASRKTPSYFSEDKLEIFRIPRLDVLIPRYSVTSDGRPGGSGDRNIRDMRAIKRLGKFSRIAALTLRYGNSVLFMLGSLWFLWKFRKQVDVWQIHVAALYSGWCGFCAKSFGVPIVCKGANIPVFPQEEAVPLRRLSSKWRQSLHFIALTTEMKEDLVSNCVLPSRITVIPNGIALPHSSPRKQLSEQTGTVLYVANFTQPTANKAYDVLFAAWRNVYKERPLAMLNVAGSGSTDYWKHLLWEYGADHSVQFLGHVDNMYDLYSQSSMFVLPSRREGISNALLEAQAHGIPAIVSNIPGNRAVVIDGQTGLVVPVDDVEALSLAIITLLDDKEKRTEMGKQAIARIEAEFSISIVVDRYLELYLQLTSVERV